MRFRVVIDDGIQFDDVVEFDLDAIREQIDAETLEELGPLAIGQKVTLGGGAQPIFEYTRIA